MRWELDDEPVHIGRRKAMALVVRPLGVAEPQVQRTWEVLCT